MIKVRTFLGLGGNLGDARSTVNNAVSALRMLPNSELLGASPLYKSSPMGPADQPDYINAVVALDTLLAPEELLDKLQDIEALAGRERVTHWGPRTLDLDILFYGELAVQTSRLSIPHPGVQLRNFVLLPLFDVLKQLSLEAPCMYDVPFLIEAVGTDGIELA